MTATSLTTSEHALPRGLQSTLPCTLPGLDGSLTLLQVVGSGSYGKVFLAKTSDGKLRAAKCIPLQAGSATASNPEVSPESEAELLRLVKHSNVIRLHDSQTIDGRLWVRSIKAAWEALRGGLIAALTSTPLAFSQASPTSLFLPCPGHPSPTSD